MFTFDEVYGAALDAAAGGTTYLKAAEQAGVLPDVHGDLECWYFGPTGQPACLVGQVLDRLDLRGLAVERETVPSLMADSAAAWLGYMDEQALRFLAEAQRIQDNHTYRPWSDCIAEAFEKMCERAMA